MTEKPILVTGATGYIGGRLVPQLLEKGYRVRCLARDPRKLTGRGWDEDPRVEIVAGDVLDPSTLPAALEGCGAAFYLVHSMAGGERQFVDRDRDGAAHFAAAAAGAKLERIIYLGGLGHRDEALSRHLESRQEVGDVLRGGPVPVTELRAAMIIGSGSSSFEMLRALVRKLPIMVCPRWVDTKTQPIAIRDILDYLIGCLERPATVGNTYDVGGPDVLTFREMMIRFSHILGKRRWVVVVPVLTPRLSAYWVNMMTPVPAGLAFSLIESLKSETICDESSIKAVVTIAQTGFDDAVRWALDKINQHAVETRWTNASLPSRPSSLRRGPDLVAFPISDRQEVEVAAPGQALFDRIRVVGGDVGWYYANALWKIRGWMDRVIGGVGLRRGRRDPEVVRIGDAVDFWRVEDVVPGRRLLLHAEMIVPGDAWLEFRVEPRDDGHSTLIQTAYFRPSPILGNLYWYLLYPLHWFIFRNMARNIGLAAEHARPEAAGVAAR